jgi:hypothetical protein
MFHLQRMMPPRDRRRRPPCRLNKADLIQDAKPSLQWQAPSLHSSCPPTPRLASPKKLQSSSTHNSSLSASPATNHPAEHTTADSEGVHPATACPDPFQLQTPAAKVHNTSRLHAMAQDARSLQPLGGAGGPASVHTKTPSTDPSTAATGCTAGPGSPAAPYGVPTAPSEPGRVGRRR